MKRRMALGALAGGARHALGILVLVPAIGDAMHARRALDGVRPVGVTFQGVGWLAAADG